MSLCSHITTFIQIHSHFIRTVFLSQVKTLFSNDIFCFHNVFLLKVNHILTWLFTWVTNWHLIDMITYHHVYHKIVISSINYVLFITVVFIHFWYFLWYWPFDRPFYSRGHDQICSCVFSFVLYECFLLSLPLCFCYITTQHRWRNCLLLLLLDRAAGHQPSCPHRTRAALATSALPTAKKSTGGREWWKDFVVR